MSLKETLFCITHPRAAFEAKFLQTEVAFETGRSPAGSTIEEFPELPVSEAAALINTARQSGDKGGGVQPADWSKTDQERMQRGERPRGVPIHENL